MNNYKTYVYDISNFTGYKYTIEKAYINSLKSIEYDGFSVVGYTNDIVNFIIDNKIIRRLKIKKFSDIKLTRIENNLSKLMELSKETDNLLLPYVSYWSSGTSGSHGCSYLEDEGEKKDRIKYQSNLYNQKIKQYENKARFRK